MEVCKHCNNYKYGSCTKLEALLEDVEDDYEANLIAQNLYMKCENDYFDYQLMQGEIRDGK